MNASEPDRLLFVRTLQKSRQHLARSVECPDEDPAGWPQHSVLCLLVLAHKRAFSFAAR